MRSALMVCMMAGGCGVGTNSLFIATRTNVGLDISSAPPAAELSIGRSEGVVAPAFEGGQTPPVLAGFQTDGGGVFAGTITSALASGDAAVALASLWADDSSPGQAQPADFDSTLVLSANPYETDGGAGELDRRPRPLVFSTDTSLGVKIAWSGAASALPDTLRVGYHRREAAWAPVGYSTTRIGPDGAAQSGHFIAAPSLLASVESGVEGRSPAGSRYTHSQSFATGAAATRLALDSAVRRAMRPRFDPAAAEHAAGAGYAAAGEEDSADRLRAWLDADESNRGRLRRWLDERGVRASVAFVVNDSSMRAWRERAVGDATLGVARPE